MPNRNGQPGTGFIPLSQWAQANRAQSQQWANKLAGQADDEAQRAQLGVDGLVADFQEQVRGSRNPWDGDKAATAAGLQAMAGQGYNGPDSLRDLKWYTPTMDAAQRAQGDATRLGDFHGRITALQEAGGKAPGAYTAGMQGFDSALVGGAGAGRFRELGQRWGGLLRGAERAEKDSQAVGREARAEAVATQQRATAALPGQQRKEALDAEAAARGEYARSVERQQDEWERQEAEQQRRLRRGAPPPKNGGSALEGWV